MKDYQLTTGFPVHKPRAVGPTFTSPPLMKKNFPPLDQGCAEEVYAHTRDHFEVGCICINIGELPLCRAAESDETAARYYWTHCLCSRHPNFVHTD